MQSQAVAKLDRFAHSRAIVRKAVHAITLQRRLGNLQYYVDPFRKERNRHVGPTYPEIRLWIQREMEIHVEGVDRRCREMFEKGTGEMRRETDEKGRVHVYPTEERKP